tara:strand:+ start:385 stop:1200 length:816 start_codon:yes stop_codon:yes gene_type:complete
MTLRLINADCLIAMKDIPDKSIDIIIADLPYGRLPLDWDKTIDLEAMWIQIWRIARSPHTPVFLFGDMKFGVQLINSQLKYFKMEIVWNKGVTTTPFQSRRMPGKCTEYIFIFYKRPPIYNIDKYHKVINDKVNKSTMPYGDKIYSHASKGKYEPRLPINILEHRVVKNKKLIKKITEKPQFLLEWILKYYSNEGDNCLDFTMGSGSTGIACQTLKRNFIGIEMKKEHFDIASLRLYKNIKILPEVEEGEWMKGNMHKHGNCKETQVNVKI